ncbi:hypothetical protein F5141DRAFT_1206209 [Pisolithus sp. B1]|nr:hypothetical protein F5141DRAFT_1206209 [Pisolithus sp. B1]
MNLDMRCSRPVPAFPLLHGSPHRVKIRSEGTQRRQPYTLHASTSLLQLCNSIGTQRPSDAAVNKHTTWLWAGSTRPQVGKESQVHLSLLHLRIRHDCVSISMFNVQLPLGITLDLQRVERLLIASDVRDRNRNEYVPYIRRMADSGACAFPNEEAIACTPNDDVSLRITSLFLPSGTDQSQNEAAGEGSKSSAVIMPVQLLHAVAVVVKQSQKSIATVCQESRSAVVHLFKLHYISSVSINAGGQTVDVGAGRQQRPGTEASSGLPLTEGVSLREDRIGLMSSLLASQPNELMRNGQSHGNRIILRFGAPPWSVVIGVPEDGNTDMRVMAGGIDLSEMDGSK